jgi:hypothetical protein
MKEVAIEREDGKKRLIATPWLNTGEAAVYCGLSRTTFDKRAAGIPCGGTGRHRRYHVDVLDKWVNNELNAPFSPSAAAKGQGSADRRRRGARHRSVPTVRNKIMDQETGKEF